jgi:cysteine desulfurase
MLGRVMTEPSYLDYNATAPLRPNARDAMMDAADRSGNPSSIHAAGRAARGVVETARRRIADLISRPPAEIIFTSGGTEADMLALTGTRAKTIVTSDIEHDAVLQAAPDARRVGVDANGVLSLEALQTVLSANADRDGPALVSVMWVNNETGVVQPIAEIARLAHAAGALLHVDAVQGVGRRDPEEVRDADLITLSAHKLGGPSGIGALVIREGIPLIPLMRGGGQEKSRRSGTENLMGIAGFGAAASEVATTWRDEVDRITILRDRIEQAIRSDAPEARIMGLKAPRVGNTSNIGLPGVPAETQVMTLDLSGVLVSAGSACSSGKVKSSHVLSAMYGDDPIAGQAIRVSLGWASTDVDVDRFIEAWRRLRARLSPMVRAA